jgi:hypothetical protein
VPLAKTSQSAVYSEIAHLEMLHKGNLPQMLQAAEENFGDEKVIRLIRHSPDSRGFGARIVPLTGSGNDKSCSVRAKGD